MLVKLTDHQGRTELRTAQLRSWRLFGAVGLFSVVVNLLMLTGPLFMMQVYDRVLTSRSEETLIALFLLACVLFLLMGVTDLARHRIMHRVAASFQHSLDSRVYRTTLSRNPNTTSGSGTRDLEAIQRLMASPVLLALFDLPWAPFFLLAVYVFHPLLGMIATGGLLILVATALMNQFFGQAPLRSAHIASQSANKMADTYHDEGEVIGALGMRTTTFWRWYSQRQKACQAHLGASDRAAGFTVFSRSFRFFLQSALLAGGAWLVLHQEATPGAMIASSIMMGRALAPVEQVVGGWSLVQRAQDAWARLATLLTQEPANTLQTTLPLPRAKVELRNLFVVPPGAQAPLLRAINLTLNPGQALGVIGSSGAGKSTLARALTGAWPPSGGEIRLGGATLSQYEPDTLGGLIGYLPQQVNLFDGTIAENIARLAPDPDPERVVTAAQAACAHDMILELPDGYDTRLSRYSTGLSGGQIQRIALARALYTSPVLLILDEPNSNLDNEGSDAMNRAIRTLKARGGTVIIMAHRPAAIAECDFLMVLERGQVLSFGPRDVVLNKAVRNVSTINPGAAGGVA